MSKLREKVKALWHVEGGSLTQKDFFSYSFAGLGQNMIYGIMNSYLMIFYTRVFGVDSKAVGRMFLAAKLWDAANDPLMGSVIDKTRTRWGKIRPYLLWTPIPIAIITVLLFTAPDLTPSGKIVYMYITYIMWGMLYTVCDVPYWSLSSVMTPNELERTKLVSFTRFLTGVGMAAPTVMVSLLFALQKTPSAGSAVGDEKHIYFITAVAMSVVGAGLLSLGFFGTKERVSQSEDKPSLKESFGYLFKNKPLMMILLCNLLAFPKAIQGASQAYVATYLLGGGEWVAILGIPGAISSTLSYTFTPALVRRFGAIKTYIIANVYTLIPMAIMYFVGFKSIPVILIFLFLTGLSGGTIGVIPTILIADCVDYMEWQTGQRAEGVSFSVQTFMAKASAALQGWALGYLLAWAQTGGADAVSYDPDKLWSVYTIIPALGSVLCIIPLIFYDLKGEKLERVRRELPLRRKEKLKTEVTGFNEQSTD